MTASNDAFSEEDQAFLPESNDEKRINSRPLYDTRISQWRLIGLLRLLLELAMASVIFFLLFRPALGTASLRRSPVPICMSDLAFEFGINIL